MDAAENFWEFEGTISAVSASARTMTVNGATFHIGPALQIRTQSLDQTAGNISLDALVAPGDIAGNATGVAEGEVVYSTTASGEQCATFTATSVYVERAENVLVGPLTAVAPDGNSVQIAGAKVELNGDTRWPASFTDGAGSDVTFAELAGHEGMLLEAEGYYDSTRQALQATHVATEQILVIPEGGDTVAIGRAEWKDDELRIGGTVAPAGTGKTVTIYDGALTGTTCDATDPVIGTASVATDGTFSYRNRNVAYPGTACVQSSGGGADEVLVEED